MVNYWLPKIYAAYTNCGPGLTYIQSPYSARTEPLQSPYRARTEPAHKYQHPAHTAQDHQQDFVIDLDNLSLGRWRCAGYWYLWVGSVRALCGLCKGSVWVLYGLCLPPASGAYLILQHHEEIMSLLRSSTLQRRKHRVGQEQK